MPLSSVVGASSILKPGVCTSTTRPAAPFEGQTIYETDTDTLLSYDGSAWVAYVKQTAGKVLQVVNTIKTDTFTATTGTGFTDITGLTVTITPSATSSKILIISTITSGLNTAGGFTLLRGSTVIGAGATAGSRRLVSTGYNQNPSAANQGFRQPSHYIGNDIQNTGNW
jgi:hypothetical protein